MTDERAFYLFTHSTLDTTGYAPDRAAFMRALHSTKRWHITITSDALGKLEDAYLMAGTFLGDEVNWRILRQTVNEISAGEMWAVFLRKEHEEMKEREE